MKNPFTASSEAKANSSYSRFVEGALVTEGQPASTTASEIHGALRAVLHDPDFPCLGAKSIMNQASYRFGLYEQLAGEGSTLGLAHDLVHFIHELPVIAGEFTSFIACFVEPKLRTPKQFEVMLWQQLAALQEVGRPYFRWSGAVSANPADPSFSFSFGGHPFFVVGLSPASQHWARRFPWPTIVFNDHFQFERLREEQRFTRLRDLIRERDTALHGEVNTMLTDFGHHSEARQYSGRRVGPNWRCPVQFDTEEPQP